MVDRIDILGVQVSALNLPLAAQVFGEAIAERRKMYVCVAPVSTIVDCQHNPEYRRVVNQADLVTPDGMPVVWLGKSKGNATIQRTYGPDLMQAVCKAGEAKGWRHYFYGGKPDVLTALQKNLLLSFPALQIAGSYAPGQLAAGAMEEEKVITAINRARPDVIWVGLGSPKQDFWLANHRAQLEAPIIAGVGAAFDFLSGAKPQAPRFMQRSGTEWIFRFCCEPGRLWRRYLIGNTQFLYYLIADRFKGSQHAS